MEGFPTLSGNQIFQASIMCGSCWFAFFSNWFLIYSVLTSRHPRSRSASSLLVCALAATDGLLGLSMGSISINIVKNQRFPGAAKQTSLGWQGPVCSVGGFFFHALCFDSIGILCVMAWERYCCIVHPLKQRTNKRKRFARRMLIYLQAGTLIFGSLPFFEEGYVLGPCLTVCRGDTEGGFGSFTFIATILTILLALFFISYCYCKIAVVLKKFFKATNKRSTPSASNSSMVRESRITFHLFVIVMVFFLFWTPMGIYMLGTAFRIFQWDDPKESLITFEWCVIFIAISNSAMNPILNILLNHVVRQAVGDQVKSLQARIRSSA